MSFYSLSFPPKTALCICYKDDENETFQEKVQSWEHLGYRTDVLKLHTRFNPAEQIKTYVHMEYSRKGVDYLYFKEPSHQFARSENIEGFAREVMIRTCEAVKDRGILEIDRSEQGMRIRDLVQICAPRQVTIKMISRYDQELQAQVVHAIETRDIEKIQCFCQKEKLFESVLSSGAVSEPMLCGLFLAVVQANQKNKEEVWEGLLDSDFNEDLWLDDILERILTHCHIPVDVLDEALQDPAKNGCIGIVSQILSTGRVSPDALGRALILAVENECLEVMQLLLKAPHAETIAEQYVKKALADAVARLPSGGFVVHAICEALLKTGIVSQKGLQEIQKEMEEQANYMAVDFLAQEIGTEDRELSKARYRRSLTCSSP